MVDTVQPASLPVSETDRRRRHLDEEAVEMEQGQNPKATRGREQTEHLASRTGAGGQGTFLHFRSREKFFLDIPFYRTL